MKKSLIDVLKDVENGKTAIVVVPTSADRIHLIRTLVAVGGWRRVSDRVLRPPSGDGSVSIHAESIGAHSLMGMRVDTCYCYPGVGPNIAREAFIRSN